MTDKQYETEKRRVRKLWEKWFRPIGMGWWQVDLNWSRVREEEEPATAAMTTTNWQYRTASVTFYLPSTSDLNLEQLEEVVVHELSHILCGPIQDMTTDERRDITEHTVTTIARAIIWAREAGEKTSKGAKK